MSDSNEHTGFSFQLSETPPPARSEEGTPLGDLDLDLGEFGESQAESPSGSFDADAGFSSGADLGPHAWADDEWSTHSRGEPDSRGESDSPEESQPNRAPEDSPAPQDDAWTAPSEAGTAFDQLETPIVSVPEIIAVTRHQAAEARAASVPCDDDSPTPAIPSTKAAPSEEPLSKEDAAEQPRQIAPRIKKIEFPARKKTKATATAKANDSPAVVKNGQTDGEKSASPGAEPSRPRTHFSASISAESPRPRLESDSDSDREDEAGARDELHPSSVSSDLALPEDLPEPGPPLTSTEQEGGSPWDSDTPSAKEIWQRARRSWKTTSRHAAQLSAQGWKAGQRIAGSVNEKVRESLRKAAEERRAAERAALAQQESSGPAPGPSQAEAAPPAPPNRTGQLILGLARTTGKKLAAPLSAAAAATVVYFAGTHLLGTEGTVALSKAVSGPQVPELGTLGPEEGTGPKKSEPVQKSSESGTGAAQEAKKAENAGPQPMQTEVTDMPDGLSWPGKGLIEVVTSEEELIYVDGVFTGRGPLRRIPVSPGAHEVTIRTEGSERSGTVEVTAHRNTRAVFKTK